MPDANHLPQSQSLIASVRPGSSVPTLPPRAPTSAGGGDHRSGAREPEPELFIARQAVVGPFRFRTRSSIAKEEALQVLQKLRLSHLLDTFPGSAPTCETVMVRLLSFEAVQMLIQAIRAQPMKTALWCSSLGDPLQGGGGARTYRPRREGGTHPERVPRGSGLVMARRGAL